LIFFDESPKNSLTGVIGVIKLCMLLILAELEGCNNEYHQMCGLLPFDKRKWITMAGFTENGAGYYCNRRGRSAG